MGATKTETVKITARDPDKFEVTGVRSSDPEKVTAELIKGKEGPEVRVTIKAGDKKGRISARVIAGTNLDKPKEITLHVGGIVSDDLWPDPPRAILPEFDEKNPPTTTIAIKSLSGKKFRLKGVKDQSGAVEGEVKRTGKEWAVNLTLTRKPEDVNGKLEVRTDRKDQQMIEVPYIVRSGSGTRINPRIHSRTSRIPPPVKMRDRIRERPPRKGIKKK